jgi:RNA polymerase sigma factor (sigma-70 family)
VFHETVEAGFATPAAATRTTRLGALGGRSPLLRLQSDERLIQLLRGGNDAAFEVLLARYRTRLLAFCRHMLGSKEDAEDILQDVFAAAYNAILADSREINARPWLYRIARNRCLNHLRRPVADSRDTMDDQLHAGGISTADLVHKRADLRHLLADVQKLPETQRTALLLREIDALSYEQISVAMETTVPSVKSLLVRARMSLAEAAEARQLTCQEVREQLAEVAEGLRRTSPALKRHVRECGECRNYRKQLRKTAATMAALFPVAPLFALKKLVLAKAGAAALAGGGGGGGGAAATGGMAAGATTGVAAGAAGGAGAGGGVAVGGAAIGAVTSKAVASLAVTAILAGGAVEAKRVAAPDHAARHAHVPATVVHSPPQTSGGAAVPVPHAAPAHAAEKRAHKAAKDSKPATTGATGGSGTTGQQGPSDSGGSGSAPGAAPVTQAPPASGSSTGLPAGATTQTGGAAPPPPAARPPAPVTGSGATGTTAPAAGSTGSTGTAGPR